MADTHIQRPTSPMSALAWGALAIGGIFAIVLGMVAILWPDATLRVVVVLLGVYAFISGIFTVLVGAVWPPGWGLRWPMVAQGVLGILVGILVFIWPETAELVLLYVIAGWAIISGILQIGSAIRLRRVIPDEWASILGGIASVVFGVLLAVWPKEGLVALVWIFGVFAVVFGIMQLVLANRVRKTPIA